MPDRSLDPVLLIASSTPGHPLVEALTELAHDTNLPINVCFQEKAPECLGEMTRAGREPSAIVLLHDVEQPLALARHLYKNALTSQFVFVVTQVQEPALRRQMMLASLIGSNWTIVPPEPEEVIKATRHAAQMKKQRKQLRTTLDRFNVRLAGEPARDTEKYRKLVISDRHLASILEHAQDIIITLNQRGSILSWNDGAAKQYGRIDALGQPITTLVVPHQWEELLASVQQVVTKNVAVLREFHALRADDSIFHAEFQLAPVRDEQGQVIAVSLLGRDVTVRVQAEQELERRVEERTAELQTVIQELEAFSYSVSHDLRAPLRGINGFSQALAEDYGPSLDDAARDYLRRIQAGASRMGELIDDLLNLSRVSRRVSRKEQVDLSEIARQVAMQLKDTHPERHVAVRIQDNVLVEGDRRLLTVALENLLANAWKFTRDQATPFIEFGTKEEPQAIYFVRDNGAGFDMAYANKLFMPFQRLHEQEEFEGTGIGLATVQRIIHRHGGRIWAEGAVGEGATFYFTLNSQRGGTHDA